MSVERNKGDTNLAKGISEYKSKKYSDATKYLLLAIQSYETVLTNHDKAVKSSSSKLNKVKYVLSDKDKAMLEKNLSNAYLALGLAQTGSSDKPDDTIKTYEKFITTHQNIKNIGAFDIYNNLGFLYVIHQETYQPSKKDNLEKAISYLTEGLKIHENYGAHYNLALAYAYNAQHFKAKDEYVAALRLTKDPVQLLTTYSKLIESALALVKEKKLVAEKLDDEAVNYLYSKLQDAYQFINTNKEALQINTGDNKGILPNDKAELVKFILQHYYKLCINVQKDDDKIPEIKKLYKGVEPNEKLWELYLDEIRMVKPQNDYTTREILAKLSYLLKHDKDTGLDKIKEIAVSLVKNTPSCGADLYEIVHSKSDEDIIKALAVYNEQNAIRTKGYLDLLEGSKQYQEKNLKVASEYFKSAVESFEKLGVENVPGNMASMAYENLGRTYFEMLNNTTADKNDITNLAKTYLEKATQYNKGSNISDIYNTLGIIYLKQDDLANAILLFGKAVKENSASFSANYNLGQVLKKSKIPENLKSAIKYLETAKSLKGDLKGEEHNNDNYNTLFNLAECYQDDGQYEKAMEAFKQALKLQANDKEKLNVYCKIIECTKKMTAGSSALKDVSKDAVSEVISNNNKSNFTLKEYKELGVFIWQNCKDLITDDENPKWVEGVQAIGEIFNSTMTSELDRGS